MQQFNELSTNDRNDVLSAIRASLMAECTPETNEATSEEPRRGWLIISDE